MGNIITLLLCLISFAILTCCWVYISANIAFYLKHILKPYKIKRSPVLYSIFIGIGLEILLSTISIIIMLVLNIPDQNSAALIRSGLKKGGYYTILISPLSSFAGALIGIKGSSPLWKRL